MERHALQLTRQDQVATAMEEIAAGDAVEITDAEGAYVDYVAALDDIPCGHKIAMQRLPTGASILKYGYAIGVATSDILRGEHVHTQNLASARGRGDI